MAGSFGYEKDKYEVSVACGERVLLPEVRKAGLSTIIMADGFSCKEQIAQETNRHALHVAEVLRMGLNDGMGTLDITYPEKQFVGPRERDKKKSMIRAAVVTLAAIGLAAAGVAWTKKR
jgi:hypothetical protein